jgi:large conductance mechanosensitive channel
MFIFTKKTISMRIIKEFREFAMKGNIIDLAVAVMIGAAFGKIITSLVDNILMPIIGSFSRINFASKTVKINGVDIKYGLFLQASADFIIVAFVLFIMVKAINKIKRKEGLKVSSAPSSTDQLLMEIRDTLKNNNR